MDTLIRLIAFHCLPYTFHCLSYMYTFHGYLTYDPDYFRGADRFPGWDSLCLDPVPDWLLCHRSRIFPIPCLLICDLRSVCRVGSTVLPRPPGDTHPAHCPGARPIDRVIGA